MDAQVTAAIKSCITCRSHDKFAGTHPQSLQPVSYPEVAWENVALDSVGPFERLSIDCCFAVTLIDSHSKWPEVVFLFHVTSLAIRVSVICFQ